MVDIETFLTTLYVMVDEFCKAKWPQQASNPGPSASLSRSEVVTLAVFGQWSRFASERGFYHYAERHLRSAFPQLPAREQFNRLLRAHREVIVSFGFGSASHHVEPLAETFFTARAQPTPALASAGSTAEGVYVADKGFAGDEPHTERRAVYGAEVISPPHQRSKKQWPKERRRWLAGLRQVVETIYDKLLNTFRLARERPRDLTGFQACLAVKVSLHNFCIWFDLQLGREPLAFADLLDW